MQFKYYDPLNENAASFCINKTLLLCVLNAHSSNMAETEEGKERGKCRENYEAEARFAAFFLRESRSIYHVFAASAASCGLEISTIYEKEIH